jgi:peptidyl-prolyl cis-trans isomerase SurA
MMIGQFAFADAMQRGSTATTTPVSAGAKTPESPVLNVPLPSANTAYYASYESINHTANSPITTVDKIVAFVNKGVVTTVEVNDQIAQTIQTYKQKGLTPPSSSDIRKSVIDELIMQKIELDFAARTGIKTTDIEVSGAINNIAGQNNMDLEQFKQYIMKQGFTFDKFKKQINNQITIDKLKQREVDGRVSVNDHEVDLVLNSEAYKNRVDYNLSDIIVVVPDKATPDIIEQKQNLAIAAYNELKSGNLFYKVSAKYSNSPNALTGGELGWKSNAVLPPDILKSLDGVPIGGITSIIHLSVGFFIFKVNDIKKHGAPQMVHQYHVRHILIKVNDATSNNEAYQKIVGIRNKILQNAKNPQVESDSFASCAKKYSEDTSSIKGGDLGWVSRGDTLPAFESAVINTPIGVISQPIHSPFGWHLLEVLEVRDVNLSNDREKAEIRQEIHDSKANTLYIEWQRNIRDAAYVKMNDE